MSKKARQRRVEQLLAMGVRCQRTIAEQLKVHPGTICKDVKEIEEHWAAIAKGETRDKWKNRHNRMLDDMLATVWAAARGQGPTDEEGRRTRLSLNETLKAQKAVLDILNERAKIEGLHAPTELNFGPSIGEVLAEIERRKGAPDPKGEDFLGGLTENNTE